MDRLGLNGTMRKRSHDLCMTMHPNRNDLAELVSNKDHSTYVSGLDKQGQDPTEVDKSERKLTDDPTALYDLGVPNASPPQ